MKKRKPMYARIPETNGYAIILPSPTSTDDSHKELELIESLVKRLGLSAYHKYFKDYLVVSGKVGNITQEAIEIIQKYHFINEDTGDVAIALYGASQTSVENLMNNFIKQCESSLGYTW